ncbi:MAG: hypothetical protein AAFW87_02185 [Pseudomonadota bacterium]
MAVIFLGMEPVRTSQEMRLERFKARSQTARKWFRLGTLGLVGLCLTAIWQDRAIAPVVHDKMQVAYQFSLDVLESNEGARGYLTAMTNFSGNGNQSEFDPITEALLKLRQ